MHAYEATSNKGRKPQHQPYSRTIQSTESTTISCRYINVKTAELQLSCKQRTLTQFHHPSCSQFSPSTLLACYFVRSVVCLRDTMAACPSKAVVVGGGCERRGGMQMSGVESAMLRNITPNIENVEVVFQVHPAHVKKKAFCMNSQKYGERVNVVQRHSTYLYRPRCRPKYRAKHPQIPSE